MDLLTLQTLNEWWLKQQPQLKSVTRVSMISVRPPHSLAMSWLVWKVGSLTPKPTPKLKTICNCWQSDGA
jgi:hypothetical protein